MKKLTIDKQDKINRAFAFWTLESIKNKHSIGIMRLQKYLYYSQILSFARNKKFLFGVLDFQSYLYGALNLVSWRFWRGTLNINPENNPNKKQLILKKGGHYLFSKKEKQTLIAIYKTLANVSLWELTQKVRTHKPYIFSRMKNKNTPEIIAKSFTVLKPQKIDNFEIKKYASQIVKKDLALFLPKE